MWYLANWFVTNLIYLIDQAADILEFFNNDPRIGNQTKNDPGQFQRRIGTQNGNLDFSNDIIYT